MFGSKDPVQQLEKQLSHASKASEKALHQAHNELEAVIKEEIAAAKAEDKAIAHQHKADKVENKTAHKLAHAQHKHDNALTDQQSAERAIALAQEQHARLKSEVDVRKAFVGQTTEHQHVASEKTAAFLEPLRKGTGPTSATSPTATSPAISTTSPTSNSPYNGTTIPPTTSASPRSNLATNDVTGQPTVQL